MLYLWSCNQSVAWKSTHWNMLRPKIYWTKSQWNLAKFQNFEKFNIIIQICTDVAVLLYSIWELLSNTLFAFTVDYMYFFQFLPEETPFFQFPSFFREETYFFWKFPNPGFKWFKSANPESHSCEFFEIESIKLIPNRNILIHFDKLMLILIVQASQWAQINFSTLNQHLFNVELQLSSTILRPQCWYLVEKWVENVINDQPKINVSITQFNQKSMKFEVEISTLKNGWN